MKWNDWNLVLVESVKGVTFRSFWIVLLETKLGVVRISTLDSFMRAAFLRPREHSRLYKTYEKGSLTKFPQNHECVLLIAE